MKLNAKQRRLTLAVFVRLAFAVSLCSTVGVQFSHERGAAAAATTKSTIINIATWPGFAPAFVAKEKRFFSDLVVDIKVVDDFSARRAAFKSGQADFTIYTVDSL